MSEMVLLTWTFMVVKFDVGVLNSPVQSLIFPPAMIIVLRVSVLCVMMSYTALK